MEPRVHAAAATLVSSLVVAMLVVAVLVGVH